MARWVRHPGDLAAALAEAVRADGDPTALSAPTVLPLPARDAARVLLEASGLGHLVAAPAAGAASAAVPAAGPIAAAASAGAVLPVLPAVPVAMESVR